MADAPTPVHRLVARERLLAVLRQRHRRRVIALEAPPGYGRSVLLGQALSEGPARSTDRDILYTCGPDDHQPGRLATGLLESWGGACEIDPDQLTPAEGAAGIVAGALRALAPTGAEVALLIDNVERSGEAGRALLPALLQRLPDHCHLVLSGRVLPPMGLAREIATGTGLLVDATDLAFRTDELAELGESHAELTLTDSELASWPALASLVLRGRAELVSAYIMESVLQDADPVVAKALAAVAAVDGCESELLDAVIIDAVDPGSGTLDEVVSELGRLPLVQSRAGCWPHPVWADVTRSILTPAERGRATLAKARGQVAAGEIGEAGRLALRARNAEALAVAVRAALGSLPPAASMADLRSWAASDLLPADSAEHEWLAGVVGLQLGDASGTSRILLEHSRKAFERAGDAEGEARVLLHQGFIARSRGDAVELGRLLQRGEALADEGVAAAQGLVALGRAVAAQLSADPEGAIFALDSIPAGSLVGEWAVQSLMIRGTNLLLAGRTEAAVAALHAATGEGSDAARAVAHDLLATARWYAGDPVGALGDADIAEALAVKASGPSFVQLVRSAKACLLAATGQSDRARPVLEQLHQGASMASSDEASALTRLAEVLLLIDAGDLQRAQSMLEMIPEAERTLRSSVWMAALRGALEPDHPPPVRDLAGKVEASRRAVVAGRAAARHLAGGPPLGDDDRPYVPARWCTGSRSSITVTLNGAGRVERDFLPVDHPAWGRARVRELCLHLAVVDDRTRAGVAAALWPDRGDRSAGLNLRVTLAHLLDVLDPERITAKGSELTVESGGSLRLARDTGLHIDLWEIERHAKAIVTAPGHERPRLLAHARRLIALEPGPPLGGVAIGEWFEPHRRRLDDLSVTASLRAGVHALGAADYALAQALGQRILKVDGWSERGHALVVEARLEDGDLDGARRALIHSVEMLHDLGVEPGPSMIELGYRVGVNHQLISTGRRGG